MTADLSTEYMGLQLPHPIVAAACPLTGDLDMLRRLEDAGVAAAVLPSLFEEQIEHDEMENHRFRETHAEAFARGDDVLSRDGCIQQWSRQVSGSYSGCEGERFDSCDCKSERFDARWLGALCKATSGSRSGCTGAQRVSGGERCSADG